MIEHDGGWRQTVQLQALPHAGGTWEGRALGADTWAPEGACDPGVVAADVLARATADSRDAALDAVEAAIRGRFRVVEATEPQRPA